MATTSYHPELQRRYVPYTGARRDTLARARAFLPLVGRLLFAAVFLVSAPAHFSPEGVAHAASQGVPIPEILVPLSGLLAIAGGASIALGFHARIGAILLAAFLLPVTLFMHRFWEGGPGAEMQYVSFLKNMSLLGTTALVGYFGSGPLSLARRRGLQ